MKVCALWRLMRDVADRVVLGVVDSRRHGWYPCGLLPRHRRSVVWEYQPPTAG